MAQKLFRKGPPLRKYLAGGRVYNWIAVAVLLLIPLMGHADTQREKFVGSHLMCICGCQQVLTECNHIHCPSSVPMREELKEKLAAGMTDDQVYAAFVSKFGTKVLAAPPFKGAFNIVAWLLSMVTLIAGGAALVVYLRRLKSAPPKTAAAPVDVSKFDKEIEDELNNFTPED
jgi:cytochrome c-type biogenesis protein CcmH/NrfF